MMKNISYSFISNIYVTILSVIFIPLYITILGSERYGLVGIYLILYPLISLMDLGFGVTIIRESAKSSINLLFRNQYIDLMRGLEIIFYFIFLILFIFIILLTDDFVAKWLIVKTELQREMSIASVLMFLTLTMRWLSILYRSCISGFEAIAWLSTFNAIIATLRFGAVIPILNFGDQTLTEFFGFQLIISVIELSGLLWKARQLKPQPTRPPSLRRSINEIRQVAGFTSAVSVGGLVWVIASQTDKIFLMNNLSISDYGFYSVAIVLSGGISILSMPINLVLLPKMSYFSEIGDNIGIERIYSQCTQIVSIVSGASASLLIILPSSIMFVWTGQNETSVELTSVISLYAAGNGLLSLSVFTHYIQISKSSMKTYLIGIVIFALIFCALSIVLIDRSGMIGGGQAWLIVNMAYFLIWTPIVHRLLAPKLTVSWFLNDIVPVVAVAMAAVYGSYLLFGVGTTRWGAAIHIVFTGLTSVTIAGLVSSYVRTLGLTKLRSMIHRPSAPAGEHKL